MRKSYVGILNRSGLCLLLPEENHVEQFLLRRATRERTLCVWAVMNESVYETVRSEIALGNFRSAAQLTEILSHDLGCIPPPFEIGVPCYP